MVVEITAQSTLPSVYFFIQELEKKFLKKNVILYYITGKNSKIIYYKIDYTVDITTKERYDTLYGLYYYITNIIIIIYSDRDTPYIRRISEETEKALCDSGFYTKVGFYL